MSMSINKMEKRILALVLAAQGSSEVGKGYWYDTFLLTSGDSRHKAKNGYASKIDCEVSAIELINFYNSLKYRKGIKRELSVNYFVEEAPDQNGYPSGIVYFEFKYRGTRYQVSFHNPAELLERSRLNLYVGKGRKTRWNRRVGGSMADIENLCRAYYTCESICR